MNGIMQALYVPKWKKIFSTFTFFSKLKFHQKKPHKPITLIFRTCQKLPRQQIYLQNVLWNSINIDYLSRYYCETHISISK